MGNMLVNNVYGRYASFFKSHELKEADEYIKRVFPNAEFYIDYENVLVFERIREDDDDAVDDVYGMDWNEKDDCNESGRDKF